MKLIDQMPHEEIVRLTSEDLERMVMYICATEGIKLLPLPKEPVKPALEPDEIAYQLDDLISYDRGPLDELAGLIFKHKHILRELYYDWAVGSEYKTLKPAGYKVECLVKVEPIKVFSEKHYANCSVALRQYTEAQKQYEADKKEYDKFKYEREKAAGWVWEKFHEAMEVKRQFEKLAAAFEQYTQLANGDKLVAWGFLELAYSPISQINKDRLNQKYSLGLHDELGR